MGIKWSSKRGSAYVTKWVTLNLPVVIYAGIYGAFNICNESLWDIQFQFLQTAFEKSLKNCISLIYVAKISA